MSFRPHRQCPSQCTPTTHERALHPFLPMKRPCGGLCNKEGDVKKLFSQHHHLPSAFAAPRSQMAWLVRRLDVCQLRCSERSCGLTHLISKAETGHTQAVGLSQLRACVTQRAADFYLKEFPDRAGESRDKGKRTGWLLWPSCCSEPLQQSISDSPSPSQSLITDHGSFCDRRSFFLIKARFMTEQ